MKLDRLLYRLFVTFSLILGLPQVQAQTMDRTTIATSPSWSQSAQLKGYHVSGILRTGSHLLSASYRPLTSVVLICASGDDGVNWEFMQSIPVNNKPPNQYLWLTPRVAFLLDSSTTYAGIGGCFTGAIYISTDDGLSWSRRDTGFAECVNAVVMLNGTLISGVDDGIFVSSDHGLNWKAADSGLSYGNYDSLYHHHPQVMRLATLGANVYAGTTGEGAFRSTDGAGSWMPIDCGLANTSLSIYGLSSLGSKLIAGVFEFPSNGPGGIFVSTNEGTLWVCADSGLSRRSIDCLYVNGQDIYAGTNYGIFHSTDEGESWMDISGGPPIDSIAVLAITVSDTNLVIGTSDGIWHRPLSQVLASVNHSDTKKFHDFVLNQNYPNPFNPCTTIRYELPNSSLVTLTVYDILGREVSVLVHERKNAGSYEASFDAGCLASGVYFSRLTAGAYTSTRKMVLVK